MAKKTARKKPKKHQKTLLGFIGRFFLLASIWGAILVSLIVLWFVQDLPNLNKLQTNVRTPSVVIQTVDGTVIGTYGHIFENIVRVEDLPPHVPQALMAVEDRRFYYHFGVDFFGLVRAAYENYRAKRVVQGGSTLTQQLAKNILFTEGAFEVNDRSIKRKILEVLLSVWLEWKFSKNDILTMYINRVYLGGGTYGIEAAAQRYFNKPARELNIFESAVIAGLLKAPSRYSPLSNPEKAKERAKTVLHLMEEAGFIKDANQHLTQNIHVLENTKLEVTFRFFCDWVMEKLPDFVDNLDRDLIIVTTLDPAMQHHADHVCKDYLADMGQQLKTTQIGFVAMSPDGAILSMVGGQDYRKSQFNRVTQALRQPGSAFKMFTYLAAMEEGFSPDDMIDDTPLVIGNWHPGNYTWKARGQVSLREAFARSINMPAIRLMVQVTPKKVIEVAHRLGITSKMEEHISLSLGAIETTLLDLTAAFATFANQGRAVWPYGILEVRDKEGNILYKHENELTPVIIKQEPLEKMRLLLREVVAHGSAYAANVSPTVMGKTGSNGDKDAWSITFREAESAPTEGFDNVVVGVWTGNDNNKNMAKASTGSKLPTRVAAAFYRGPELYEGANKPPKKVVLKNTEKKAVPAIKKIETKEKDVLEDLLTDIN